MKTDEVKPMTPDEQIDDGGPAFPEQDDHSWYSGKTPREAYENLAKSAYDIADAMIQIGKNEKKS